VPLHDEPPHFGFVAQSELVVADLVIMRGFINAGDEQKFIQLTEHLENATVTLSSPGGEA
jgi:hypothetical protein